MSFTAKDVAALRERTGCGMMDCKKVLTDADGDMDKAIELLRERGLAAQTKKAGRIAAEGVVYATSTPDCGVIIEVNSETDFVAKNEKFMALVSEAANAVIKYNPAEVDALLKCECSEGTIEEMLRERILTIGENMKIRRFERVEGITVPYIHMGGVYATLVQFDTDAETAAKPEFLTFGKDIAMQIAALNPGYLDEASVPANILEKILAGGLCKYFKEVCLLYQAFVNDGSMSVKEYVAKTAKELGADIKILGFTDMRRAKALRRGTRTSLLK